MRRRGFIKGLAGLPLLGFLSGEARAKPENVKIEVDWVQCRPVEPEFNAVVDQRSLEEVMATDPDSCVPSLKEIGDWTFGVDIDPAVLRMMGETDDELKKRIKKRLADG